MSEQIFVIDSSEIKEGKLPQVKGTARELADFVQARESRPIAYEIYFDEAAHVMTVLQVHPNAASMELHMEVAAPVFARFAGLLKLHMEVAAPVFARFAGLLKLQRIDVYGPPSEKLLAQLRRKAEMLGGAPLAVHSRDAGFARWPTPSAAAAAPA